ncbi:MAG: ATP-dependent DNA helicase RecG [Armatimonadetes bacterium]|nr:ATP-dependent DNA helicase RecG [Armatimonadota bacterium]
MTLTETDKLQTPVQYVKGVGPRLATTFERIGVKTVEDLLYYFPRRYEDRSRFKRIAQLADAEFATVSGRVVACDNLTAKTGRPITKVAIDDGSAKAFLIYFNQPFQKTIFQKMMGSEIVVYGEVERNKWGINITRAEWEELADEGEELHTNRIVPIYPLTEGLFQKTIRRILRNAVELYLPFVKGLLPPAIVAERKLMDVREAFRNIHFPETEWQGVEARRRLVFEELFILQLALALRKHTLQSGLPGISFKIEESILEEFHKILPFDLTGAQKRVIGEISGDMEIPHPMSRLLQGDVGSGKTMVAAAAVLTAARNGFQAALMAPTEILAEQHYSVMSRLLSKVGIEVDLLVGALNRKGKTQVKDRTAMGLNGLVVGTHALIQEGVEFKKLGLVIIDEQHRFGVLQRMELMSKGNCPDLLVMTATPIPRTLALTLYGDLDVSVIDEMPPGRKPVITHWKPKREASRVYGQVAQLVREGRQAYIVCPLVEESEKLQAKAAVDLAAHLQSDIFSDLKVEALHGQMASWEKDDIMERFREREIDVLVSTVVIEVGVDVPNATIMIIQDAERFGLSQLHQLRGRVGRGQEQSFCILLGDPKTMDGKRRLETMVRTTDGFDIAEEDLRLRGPGEFYGTRQSGLMSLRIANLAGDTRILDEARRDAFELAERDPLLEHPDHQALSERLHANYENLIWATVS